MSGIQKIAFIVNGKARQNKAADIWQKTRAGLFTLVPNNTQEIIITPELNFQKCLKELLADGVNCFISVGGDGSVHILLNALMQLMEDMKSEIYLGGVGLGSSNDFLKPYGSKFNGLRVRMDLNKARCVDVGFVKFTDENGLLQSKYFIANASIGVTAKANYTFNNPGLIISFLKKYWTSGAIIWTALKTIFLWHNIHVHITYNNVSKSISLSNMAVLKNPFISGNFHYDSPILSDDGWLSLNYCSNMNRVELLHTLYDLSKGIFSGKPKRHSYQVKKLFVRTSSWIELETDGEVCLVKNPEFGIVRGAIRVLGPGITS